MARIWRYLNPFYAEHRTLLSPLPPAECARRLGERLLPGDSIRLLSPFYAGVDVGVTPAAGWASAERFSMLRLNRGQGDLGFATVSGRFRSTPEGTVITVRLGTAGWVVFGIVLVIVLLGLFALLSTLAASRVPSANLGSLASALWLMTAIGLGVVGYFLWVTEPDLDFLFDLIRTNLRARESDVGAPETSRQSSPPARP